MLIKYRYRKRHAIAKSHRKHFCASTLIVFSFRRSFLCVGGTLYTVTRVPSIGPFYFYVRETFFKIRAYKGMWTLRAFEVERR